MRISPFFTAIVLGTILAACDGPPDEVSKDVTNPEEVSVADAGHDAADEHDESDEHHEEEAHEAGDPEHDEDHGHEDGARLEAHEHGRATLAAAVDGEELSFSFEVPLASMVGFEHEPETAEQTKALDDLKEVFITPGSMVSINREAGCLPQTTTSGTHRAGDHGALEVEHVYTCEDPGRIERIEFLLAEDYPALETIDAIFLSDTGQTAAELTAANPVLKVR